MLSADVIVVVVVVVVEVLGVKNTDESFVSSSLSVVVGFGLECKYPVVENKCDLGTTKEFDGRRT